MYDTTDQSETQRNSFQHYRTTGVVNRIYAQKTF